MRKILKRLIINTGSLWLLGIFIPAISFNLSGLNFLITGIALTILDYTVKPLINLLLLPLNLITMGSFRWISTTIILLILTIIIPQIYIHPINIPHISLFGITLPALYFGRTFSLIIISLILTLVRNFLIWLLK
jgi:putative membrane protein